MEKEFVHSRCLQAIASLNLKEGRNEFTILVVGVSDCSRDQWHLPKMGGIRLVLQVKGGVVVSGSIGEKYCIAYMAAGLSGDCVTADIVYGADRNDRVRIYLDIPLEGGNPARQFMLEMLRYENRFRDTRFEPIHEWLHKILESRVPNSR